VGFDKSLLVTGAGGQLGRALATLVPEGLHLGKSDLDITDRVAVLDKVLGHRPEVIINTAAYTRVDAAEADPEAAFAVNAAAVNNLAEATSKSGSLLVQLSTDYVFRGDKQGAYLEDDETGPLSIYGKSKLEGEKAASGAERHLILRSSWVFGEGHNFIRSILNAAASREELAVVDDQRGLPTYARDLAQGLLKLVNAGATGIYHLAGGGDPATWADLAELALEASRLPTKVRRITTAQYYAERPGPVAPRPANSVLDCSKAASLGVRLRRWPEAVLSYVKGIG
jgi:dTDP-4-dehydrorhamnose reductase